MQKVRVGLSMHGNKCLTRKQSDMTCIRICDACAPVHDALLYFNNIMFCVRCALPTSGKDRTAHCRAQAKAGPNLLNLHLSTTGVHPSLRKICPYALARSALAFGAMGGECVAQTAFETGRDEKAIVK